MKTKTTARSTTTRTARTNTQTATTQEIAMNTKTTARMKTLSNATPAGAIAVLAAPSAAHDASRATPSNSLYVQLLEELRPELDAIASDAQLPMNLDIPTAIHHVRSALPVLELLRPQAAAIGTAVDMKQYDRLGDYARLLQYTHGCYLATIDAPDTVSETYEATVRARDLLLAWCPGLVAAKLLPQALLDQLNTGIGHQNAVTSVTALTSALRAIWPQIEGKVMITAAQLDEADALAEKLAEGIALRDSLVETLSKRMNDRQLAFTLFSRAYAEARAIVIFVRRKEGDGERLVPSIYTKAPSVRRNDEPAEPAPVAPVVVTKPVVPGQPVVAPKPEDDAPLNQSSPFVFPVQA